MVSSDTYGSLGRLDGLKQDPRYSDFLYHFNVDYDYFECHEFMEELWLDEGRHPLLQGLLQAAVGLYHWSNGNFSGAVKLMTQAQSKLAGYPDEALGLNLADLKMQLDRSLTTLVGDGDGPVRAPFESFPLSIVDLELAETSKIKRVHS